MTELRFQGNVSLEDAEIQRTQLYAALKAADQRYVPSLQQEDGLGAQTSARSISLRSRYSASPSQIARTRSAVRGPVTDGRGLGSLAPFVLPGILKRASMGFEPQMSTLQVFSSQSLSGNQDSPESSGRGRPRASSAPRQRPPGIHCITAESHVSQQLQSC